MMEILWKDNINSKGLLNKKKYYWFNRIKLYLSMLCVYGLSMSQPEVYKQGLVRQRVTPCSGLEDALPSYLACGLSTQKFFWDYIKVFYL